MEKDITYMERVSLEIAIFPQFTVQCKFYYSHPPHPTKTRFVCCVPTLIVVSIVAGKTLTVSQTE
jgi:hypothetical protein